MKTVLLCEDDEDMVRLIRLVVERAGYALKAVADGRQAVVTGLKEAPDLILMDLRMPNLDGIGAIKALRQGGFAKPIVALTASDKADDRKKVREAGGTDFILKTFVLSDVEAALVRLLGDAEEYVVQDLDKPGN